MRAADLDEIGLDLLMLLLQLLKLALQLCGLHKSVQGL